MFTFNYAEGATLIIPWLASFIILAILLTHNELARRYKWVGLASFTLLPIILTIIWLTVLKEETYTDWFHLAKVYSATIGALGFWFIRHYENKDKKTGKVLWRLADKKWALAFPPLILGINILEAVARDIEVGTTYWMVNSGAIEGEVTGVMGGIWNYMNGAAGILNIIAMTGWFGICIRKVTSKDKSKDMLWPDMIWFWIVAYDLWNFAYTYNCIPSHSWYAGIPMLIAPTVCAFTLGKGAWLQHRATTLAMWCMFAQTFPMFQDTGIFKVVSTYDPTIYTAVSGLALAVNIMVVGYMIYKVVTTKRNPYKGELYVDTKAYGRIKALAE
jgi:hypothetical protein